MSVRKDLLFVHPGGQGAAYQRLSASLTAVAPPLWSCLLAARARREGWKVAIHDSTVDGWDEAIAAGLLDRHDPMLVVVMVYGHNPSASTQTMPAAGRIVRDIRRLRPGVFTALGGPHPSALPGRTLSEEAADFVIQGEGTFTIGPLLAHLRGDIPAGEVPGLWHRGCAGIEFNGPAPLNDRLDETLGEIAWDLLPGLDRYRAHAMHCFQLFEGARRDDFMDARSPYATLATSLGCPHACDYCCVHVLDDGAPVRYWSLDTVVSWIDELATGHGVRNIRIEDDLFLLSPRRVEDFCDRVAARGHDLNLWVYGRVDSVPLALLPKLRGAGVSWICLGIESGVASVREGVGKTVSADPAAVVRAIRDAGIHVLGNFMFGLPDDDLASMQATLGLARSIGCDYANFYSTMAYPGSALYARHAGGPDLPAGWEGYAQLGFDARPLPTRHLGSREVLRFRDEAFRSFFTDPAYLAALEERFGPRVVRYVGEMTRVGLRRRLLEDEG
jgi:radical SAM superfamily enzyme YgiQ (UPF0313 family)